MNRDLKVNYYNDKEICKIVRTFIENCEYDKCEEVIMTYMNLNPHSASPHNLLGILLEKKGKHDLAMKHFRVSWDLDPTFFPARHNLEYFGTFFSKGTYAYEFEDIECDEIMEKIKNVKKTAKFIDKELIENKKKHKVANRNKIVYFKK